MLPSFSKNLGPISIKSIKKRIACQTVNISDDEQFKEFVGIKNIKQNSLTFLNNNEPVDTSINDVTVICTEKKFKSIKINTQKALLVQNMQEAVAQVSNLFYRDYTKEEISKLKETKYW